jgi:hypothetical protein
MSNVNDHILQTLEDNEDDDFTLEDLRKYDPKKFIFWGLTVSFFSEAATFPMVRKIFRLVEYLLSFVSRFFFLSLFI